MGFLNPEKTIDELEAEEERVNHKLRLSEMRVLLTELKKS